MKLLDYFNGFLKEEVNLDDARLNRLNGSVAAITNFLEGSATFAASFIGVIPQGSYAHKTIIKPVHAGDEFDADLLLYLTEVPDREPEDYVEGLFAAFRGSGTYKEKAGRRTRCVTIDYAGDFHIDVVPFLERYGHKYITNRHENSYELTNPEGYNAWLDEKNRMASRHLVKVIRLVKYLRDYKRTFDVKSVILNVLLGERVTEAVLFADPDCFSDVPTALRTVMNRLSEFVTPYTVLPSIMDPSETGENFSDRWSQDGYAAFRTAVIRYASWIDDAWAEPDKALSLTKWQRVFGKEFQAPHAPQSGGSLVKSSSVSVAPYRNTEQKLEDVAIRTSISSRYRFRISGRVVRKMQMGAYYLKDRGNRVLQGRNIRFQIEECNVPEPYRIYWKVLNRGVQAREKDCIRGQIQEGARAHEEPTVFTGPHFVECYIVRDGVCVARDRQEVIII